MSQLRRRYPEIVDRGAEVVAIGQGWPAMAADFKRKFKIPFPLLVDQERETYRAIGLKRGSNLDVIGPGVIARGTLEVLKGNMQALPPKGTSRMQLGGVVVVDKGGEVLFVHRSDTADDNVPLDRVLEVLR